MPNQSIYYSMEDYSYMARLNGWLYPFRYYDGAEEFLLQASGYSEEYLAGFERYKDAQD